jgi:hypothetical protein
MRRLAYLILAVVWLPAAFAAVDKPNVDNPHPSHPYRQHWKQASFGKVAAGGVVAKAGIGQLLGHPRNYGGGIQGFGKRLGAGFTTHMVKTTVEHAIAAPLHEDLRYHRSDKTGFRPRLWYALRSTVITHNTRTGGARPAVGRLSGHAAAGILAEASFRALSLTPAHACDLCELRSGSVQ